MPGGLSGSPRATSRSDARPRPDADGREATGRRFGAIALVVLVLSASVPRAQDDAAPPAAEGTEQQMVATVNGEPITSTDVGYLAVQMSGGPGNVVEPGVRREARRLIAERMLLAAEAKRLGLELSPVQFEDNWRRFYGELPDFELSAGAAGTTVDRQRELAMQAVLSSIYLFHRVGLGGEFSHKISPDALLAREVSVTPGELREFFREQKDRLREPPTVSYAVYPCADELEAAHVSSQLTDSADPPEGIRAVREIAPVPLLGELFGFSPALAEFLASAPVGSISSPHESGGGVLVVQVVERTEGQDAVFSELQDELRLRIQNSRLNRAREKLVRELSRQAVYWPKDLFDLGAVAADR